MKAEWETDEEEMKKLLQAGLNVYNGKTGVKEVLVTPLGYITLLASLGDDHVAG